MGGIIEKSKRKWALGALTLVGFKVKKMWVVGVMGVDGGIFEF